MSTLAVTQKERLTQAIDDGAEARTDVNRELRSMLLSVHPCPPLPQIAGNNAGSCERVFSSHDFLATAIDRMLIQPDVLRDTDRRDNQLALCKELSLTLKHVLDGKEHADKPEAVYSLLTCFARGYVKLYFDKKQAESLDIRFKPLDHVCKGNTVHMLACSHLRAYRIMKGVEPSSDSQFEDLSYSHVLMAFAKEIVEGADSFV
jgi:hypothetical protein